PQVLGHLTDAVLLTLDDVRLWVVDGVDGAAEQLERASGAAAVGLDNALTRLEDATAYYLPLPPQLRVEWERRVKELDDEEEDDEEPRVRTRVFVLLLSLRLQLGDSLLTLGDTLQTTAHQVGLGWVLQLVGVTLQYLKNLLVALAYRAQNLLVTYRTQSLLVELAYKAQNLWVAYQAQNLLVELAYRARSLLVSYQVQNLLVELAYRARSLLVLYQVQNLLVELAYRARSLLVVLAYRAQSLLVSYQVQNLLVDLGYRVQSLLVELGYQAQNQQPIRDLLELSQVLLQLVINSTPLYTM
ncbi:uncharacterized protein LOC117940804, partial [Etheostoma cragini]|uniref:uncharacterized protein LOC117940804 n=1 Tax=Etheostoma cragini TaxID=417921 RepID=UPI00155E4E22